MSNSGVKPGRLRDVLLLDRPVFRDARGVFSELWHEARYREAGLAIDFVQDNFSRSSQHTLRGLHYQVRHPQAKLVTCVRGEIWDVAVDLRPDSDTFGQWESVVLSDENGRQIFVPPGFAHGFLVLSEEAEVIYKCDRHYDPSDEFGIHWKDPFLNIDWPVSDAPLLSPKDEDLPCWNDVPEDRRP